MTNNSSSETMLSRLSTSDFIQLTIKSVLLFTGIILNMKEMMEVRRFAPTAYARLKCQLCFSDILLITAYSVYSAIWILARTVTKVPGVCKVMQFTLAMAFYVCAFVTVSIAVERVLAVYKPLRVTSEKLQQQRTALVIMIGWMTAVVLSLPQLYIWLPGSETAECITVWQDSAETSCLNSLIQALKYANQCVSRVPTDILDIDTCIEKLAYKPERLYRIVHLCITFWLPLFAILTCNFLVYLKLRNYRRYDLVGCIIARRVRRFVQRAAMKRILILTAFFVLCWLPNNACELLNIIWKGSTTKAIPYTLDVVILWAVLNPYIYRKPYVTVREQGTNGVGNTFV